MKNYMKDMLNNLFNKTLVEMRVAPDQSKYPLSRRQLEKLLTQYERREDEDNWNDNPEYRTIEGQKRCRWYPPEVETDTKPEDLDFYSKVRPAKLMPYDYYYSIIDDTGEYFGNEITDNDDIEHDSENSNWSGSFNPWR